LGVDARRQGEREYHENAGYPHDASVGANASVLGCVSR
jgi:hypothetical protein